MRRPGRNLTAAMLALCVGVLPHEAAARHAAAPETGLRTVEFGKAPPDFTFDVGTGPQTLASLRGKPVVLNFWASYCEPCRDELDTFERLQEAFGSSIDLLTITDQPPGVARTYLRARGIDLPLIDDPADKIWSAYDITPIPVTIVLRADGTVSYVSIGEMGYPELRAAVAAAFPPAPGSH